MCQYYYVHAIQKCVCVCDIISYLDLGQEVVQISDWSDFGIIAYI